MISSVDNNITALNAFQKKMNVTSDNIANVNTDGFKKSRVTFSEQANGGVDADVQRIDTPGPPNPDYGKYPNMEQELSNVNLNEEIPGMIPTQRAFEANLTAIKTQSEMIGSLLDIMG